MYNHRQKSLVPSTVCALGNMDDISHLPHLYLPVWVGTCHLLDFGIQSPTPCIPLQFTPRSEQRDLLFCRQRWDYCNVGRPLPKLCRRAGPGLVAGSHGMGMVPQHEQSILFRIVGLQPVRVPTCRGGHVGLELSRRERLSSKVARTDVGVDEVNGFTFLIAQRHRWLDSELNQVSVHQNQLKVPDWSVKPKTWLKSGERTYSYWPLSPFLAKTFPHLRIGLQF